MTAGAALPDKAFTSTTPTTTASAPTSAPAPVRETRAKRMLDLVGAGTMLVVLAPVLLILALSIRLSGPGPVLFRQTRVGRGGRPITILKFRTMVPDAEMRLADLQYLNDYDDGPLFKLRDDPRVTRVGRLLRRFSLDELPQLWNVLTGSMSLVGPRPALPEEVAEYTGDTGRRLLVNPGLTGLWQVSGRNDLSWDEGVALDLHYVERGSVLLDLWILIRTVPAVVFARGAY